MDKYRSGPALGRRLQHGRGRVDRDTEEIELPKLRSGQNAELGRASVAANQAADEERHEEVTIESGRSKNNHKVRVDLADFEANE